MAVTGRLTREVPMSLITPSREVILTPLQYSILLNLYHEMNEAFLSLGMEYRCAFFTMLHQRGR